MAERLIEIRDLTRTYKRPRTSLRKAAPEIHALRGVTFDVQAGQRFGIVGESGSGKSTLVRLLSALDRPTSGSIKFEGTEIAGLSEGSLTFLRRQLQIVFQDPMGSLDPRMRVRDIIAEPLRRPGATPRPSAARASPSCWMPSACPRTPARASRTSSRAASASASRSPARCRVRPQVLVADEPVSALDVSVRAQILNLHRRPRRAVPS